MQEVCVHGNLHAGDRGGKKWLKHGNIGRIYNNNFNINHGVFTKIVFSNVSGTTDISLFYCLMYKIGVK